MNYSFDPVGNILGYSNNTDTYSTSQSYSYDSLYQLTGATGTSSSHPFGITDWTSTYQQSFAFDGIGNMTKKTSSVNTNPSRNVGDGLNYSLNYSYYTGKAHQAEIIGDLYYRYDANGNTIEERQGGHGTGTVLGGTVSKSGMLRMTDRGFGLVLTEPGTPAPTVYSREFVWDEENRLQRTVDSNLTVDYRYGADGQRAVKYSSRGESLYFDSLWSAQTDAPSLRQSKQVYVGSTRIATQLNIAGNVDVGYEQVNTYYYHPDHLGSSQLVTDYQGKQYEHVEYTPYGETWIDQETDSRALLPYKFTSKELGSETGLYYYGARYLNPKTSRWISPDPAMADYLPLAPTSDDAKKHNQNLPGMGGVFNLGNAAIYGYAGNSPVKYTDPDGQFVWLIALAVVVAITMASDSLPYHAPPVANPASVNARLSELPYGDEPPIMSNASIPSMRSEDDITLYRNLVAAIGSTLPAGEPQPEDFDTGDSKMSSVIGAVSLFGTVVGNLTDEMGRMSGDITLVISGRNGVPTSWKILLTASLPGKAKENFDLNMDQAKQFLADNKDALVKAGKYDEIARTLGMQ